MTFHVPEQYRIRRGRAASSPADGNNGAFNVPVKGVAGLRVLFVMASDGHGWEHVSASFKNRTPSWDHMCQLRDIFWDPDDCVMQLHPPRSQYVNHHNHCLHLWRPIEGTIPMPPAWMVGPGKWSLAR